MVISHFSWELLQQALALIICSWLSLRRKLDGKRYIFRGTLFIETSAFGSGAGLSLGNIVLHGPQTDTARMQHEFGHCIQSRALGPFYLPFIGLPSLAWATFLSVAWKKKRLQHVDYDAFFIEKNASSLGKRFGRELGGTGQGR